MNETAVTRTIPVGEHTLAYSDAGRGTPVVLLHSGGLSSRQWGRLADELGASHRVIVPDFLGYGRSSPWPRDREFHFRLDVRAIASLVDSLSEPVHLVGHSYGGFVALLVALERPRRVRSLALFEPVAFGVLHSLSDTAARSSLTDGGVEASLLDPEIGGQEPWLRAFVDYWNAPGAWDRLPEPAQASFRAVAGKLFGEVRSLLLDRTPHETYATLGASTLLVSAEASPLAARRVVAHLADVIPGARVRTITGAGHMAPITHAGVVNGFVTDHIERTEREARE
jgi:pimeloyl-ACP methyl ester carboxylesterase